MTDREMNWKARNLFNLGTIHTDEVIGHPDFEADSQTQPTWSWWHYEE